MIFIRKFLFVIFVMSCVLLVSSLVFAQTINQGAYFVIDTNLAQTGYQANEPITNIGPNQKVGFAVYAGYVDGLKSYNVDVQWDSALATRSDSDADIAEDDDIAINGQVISLAPEANILIENFLKVTDVNIPGHFGINCGIGLDRDSIAKAGYGLLYYFELETASDFTTNIQLQVNVRVKLGSAGIEPPIELSRGVFLVNTIVPGVKSSTWGEVKKKFKDF